MLLNEYQAAAVKTMNPALTAAERVTNCALGIADEIGELAEVLFEPPARSVVRGYFSKAQTDNLVEETGDLMWYCSVALASLSYDLPPAAEITSPESANPVFDSDVASEFHSLIIVSNRFIMHAKKIAFQGHALTDDVSIDMRTSLLGSIVRITNIVKMLGLGLLSDVCEANVSKLLKRYPNGVFTAERSINRT